MPLGNYAIDISDMKYALVTADTGTDGPTYGTLKDMPAAAEMSVTFESGDERTLEGDGGIVQVNTAKGPVKGTLRMGGLHLSVIADLFGHTYVTSGTTPNQIRSLHWNENASRPHFKVEGQALNNDGGDSHILAWKCQVDKEFPDLGLTQGNWLTKEIPIILYPTVATKVIAAQAMKLKLTVTQNETVTAIV